MFTAECASCGHVSRSQRSQGFADRGIKRHSCGYQQARRERAERYAEKLTQSGTGRPCVHTTSDGNEKHPHGTRDRYVTDRCRCRACRDATNVYEQDRAKRKAYGKPTQTGYTPTGPIREHVTRLLEQGMTIRGIARASGASRVSITKLIEGTPGIGRPPTRHMQHKVAERILAVRFENHMEKTRVDSNGTRLRLRALVAIGWPQATIAGHLGLSGENYTRMMKHHTPVVTAKFRGDVTRVYNELWDKEPTPATSDQRSRGWITKSRVRAQRLGWVPPMMLDDDLLDTPGYDPKLDNDHIVAWRTKPIIMADLDWLASCGYDLTETARRLGKHPESIERACRRDGRTDILERMRVNRKRPIAS